jgi:hypothetical protein
MLTDIGLVERYILILFGSLEEKFGSILLLDVEVIKFYNV